MSRRRRLLEAALLQLPQLSRSGVNEEKPCFPYPRPRKTPPGVPAMGKIPGERERERETRAASSVYVYSGLHNWRLSMVLLMFHFYWQCHLLGRVCKSDTITYILMTPSSFWGVICHLNERQSPASLVFPVELLLHTVHNHLLVACEPLGGFSLSCSVWTSKPVSHYSGFPEDSPSLCSNSRVILRGSAGDSL